MPRVLGCGQASSVVQYADMVGTRPIFSPVNVAERSKLDVRAGDTVRVWQKIQEKGKTRLQAFEGLVLARKHGSEAGATFTVRRVASGVGVEKTFPIYSPVIDRIEIVRRAKVRRAKLYYIREKVAREIKRQMRRSRMMGVVVGGAEAAAEAPAESEELKAETHAPAPEEKQEAEAKE